jgi:hypothetical protein
MEKLIRLWLGKIIMNKLEKAGKKEIPAFFYEHTARKQNNTAFLWHGKEEAGAGKYTRLFYGTHGKGNKTTTIQILNVARAAKTQRQATQ